MAPNVKLTGSVNGSFSTLQLLSEIFFLKLIIYYISFRNVLEFRLFLYILLHIFINPIYIYKKVYTKYIKKYLKVSHYINIYIYISLHKYLIFQKK